MALQMKTPDGKNRCFSQSPQTGYQCTKRRKHVNKDIDVVHQHGMFVWRDGSDHMHMTLGNPKVVVGGVDLTSMVRDVGIQVGKDSGFFSTSSADVPRETAEQRFGKGHAATFGIQDETHAYQQGGTPWATEEANRIMHSMCTEPCGPTCKPTATPEQQLTEWWIQQAEDEVARTVPKAIEYSAIDLTDIGHDLARTAGREVDDEEAAELGVFFYLRGKMARWVGAVIAGERVSDDTLFDIGVYVRMAQRIREKGNWPGVEQLDA